MDNAEKRMNRILGQLVKEAERDNAKAIARLLKMLREEMGRMYEKYEKGGTLTYAEMTKFNRLEKVFADIKEHTILAYDDIFNNIERALKDVYQEGYYLTAWKVQEESQKAFMTSAVGEEVVRRALDNPISGLTLADTLEKKRVEIEYTIRQTVNRGLVEGVTYAAMANELVGKLDNDNTKAVRIVRTEAHRVMEQGRQDSRDYADAHGVVTMKEWLSGADKRVRDTHRRLNGRKIKNDEYFEASGGRALVPGGFGIAREDVNCRCITITSVESIKKPSLKDIERMTYEEFKGGLT